MNPKFLIFFLCLFVIFMSAGLAQSPGTQKWAFTTGGTITCSSAIGSDGTIYFGCNNKKLYSVYSTSLGLAAGSWPKFRQNNQNTGCERSAAIFSMTDQIQFDFYMPGAAYSKEFTVRNMTAKTITLNSCVFSYDAFTLVTPLPMTIQSMTKSTLTTTIQPDSSGLYQSSCQLNYESDGVSKFAKGKVRMCSVRM